MRLNATCPGADGDRLTSRPRAPGDPASEPSRRDFFTPLSAEASRIPGIDTRHNMSKLLLVKCSKNDNALVLAGAGGPLGVAMSGADDPILSRHAGANRPVFNRAAFNRAAFNRPAFNQPAFRAPAR